MSTITMQKVTVSLPKDLLAFADMKAVERGVSRSKLIADLLADLKMSQEDALAAEGYQFYAQESEEFAAASQQAVLETWGNES
ncbi:MAG: CopG family ribbon-helix-helix protein [Anaerolineales bacterium]